MDLTKIKNIVFDLGGVLITLDMECSVRRFVSLGLTNAAELLDCYHQRGPFLGLEDGSLSPAEFHGAVRIAAGLYIKNKDIDWAWRGFIVEMPVYKLKMLEKLRERGYKLYLLSNTNPFVMKWAMSPFFSPNNKPISDYFDKLYLSYEMRCVKPNQIIFDKMIYDSGIKPTETLFIDDGAANIETAQKLGFKTYLAKNGEDFRYALNL